MHNHASAFHEQLAALAKTNPELLQSMKDDPSHLTAVPLSISPLFMRDRATFILNMYRDRNLIAYDPETKAIRWVGPERIWFRKKEHSPVRILYAMFSEIGVPEHYQPYVRSDDPSEVTPSKMYLRHQPTAKPLRLSSEEWPLAYYNGKAAKKSTFGTVLPSQISEKMLSSDEENPYLRFLEVVAMTEFEDDPGVFGIKKAKDLSTNFTQILNRVRRNAYRYGLHDADQHDDLRCCYEFTLATDKFNVLHCPLRMSGTSIKAHHFMWLMTFGEGYHFHGSTLKACQNQACVNPFHYDPVY